MLVNDSYGDPVAGTTVNFAVVTTAGAGATFAGAGSSAAVQTDENGVAASPSLTAGTTAGAFTVTASVQGANSMATFDLTDRAGVAANLTAGVGTSQSTELGTDFPVPLAVTVTDTDANPLPGATVIFSAPKNGASGVFAGAGATATVLTNSDGVATAPDFSANGHTGGYVVTASVGGITTLATFALVNEPRSGASASGLVGSYWLVTSTGKVLRSGDAGGFGSMSATSAAPVVAMAATPDGQGYWLVTSKGVVRAFGDAVNYGSPSKSKLHLSKPIVGLAATADGKGYWLVASTVPCSTTATLPPTVRRRNCTCPSPSSACRHHGRQGLLARRLRRWRLQLRRRRLLRLDGRPPHVQAHSGHRRRLGRQGLLARRRRRQRLRLRARRHQLWLRRRPFAHARQGLVPTENGAGYWIVSANGTAAGFGNAGAQGSPTSAKTTVVGGAA